MNFSLDDLVELLKAAGEPTRLRLLALLEAGDLTVTDLTDILGQSQPRISRHLKLLAEAGLIDRYQEGAWAYFRLKQQGRAAGLARMILASAAEGDPILKRDAERLSTVKRVRAEKAQAYFSKNAAEWDELRRLHVDDRIVEQALLDLIGDEKVEGLLDLGTGTGRILQLLEGRFEHGVGIDASRDMLAVARSNLDKIGLAKASVRHGDILNLPLDGGEFDVITIHQVLHFLEEPELAIKEAARMLKSGGRLAIIDLAPHGLDYLRDEHAHIRLGFSHEAISHWLRGCGLTVEQIVDVPPVSTSANALTVTIWLARRTAARLGRTEIASISVPSLET